MVSVSVPESALVVVGGARFTGREALLYELLASQAGQSAVISTCKTGEKAREQYHAPDETAKRLAVVDCVSVPAGCPEKADEHHLLAAHPTDLTDIGTRTSELFEITNSADGVLAVSNVTALTVFHDSDTVLRFVHKLQQLATSHGWGLVVEVDTTVERDQVIAQLSERANTLIQTRTDDGTHEYRVHGKHTQQDWQIQPAAIQPATMTAATTGTDE